MSEFDLTGKNIQDTFQNLLQKTGSDGRLYDLEGNQVRDLTIDGTLTANTYITSESITATSSGSTAFGNSADDTHTFQGHITAGGNISASGKIITSQVGDESGTHDLLLRGDNVTIQTDASGDITFKEATTTKFKYDGGEDSFTFTGNITASGNISSSGNLFVNTIYATSDTSDDLITYSAASDVIYVQSQDINLTPHNGVGIGQLLAHNNLAKLDVNGNIKASSHITASGNISSSGDVISNQIQVGGGTFTSASLAAGGVSSDFTSAGVSGSWQGQNFISSSQVQENVGGGVISGSAQFGSSDNVHFNHITASGNISASGDLIVDDITADDIAATNVDVFDSDAGNNPRLRVGRQDGQHIEINVIDNDNTIKAEQDSDSDGEHNFILTREFDGTGANNFKIQKGTSDELIVDTGGNVSIQTGSLNLVGQAGGHITASGNISSSGTVKSKFMHIPISPAGDGTDFSITFGGDTSAKGKIYDDNTQLIFNYDDTDVIQFTDTLITLNTPSEIIDDTDATDASGDTGALRVEGGASIAKKAYVGTQLSVGSHITASGNISASGTITAEHIVSSDDLYVTDRLGIGDSTPDAPLGITSADNILAKLYSTDDSAKIQLRDDTTTGFWNVKDDYHSFGFDGYPNRSALFVVSGSEDSNGVWGKVGIGTTAPTVPLQVEGIVSASSFVTHTHITASGNISSSGTIYGKQIHWMHHAYLEDSDDGENYIPMAGTLVEAGSQQYYSKMIAPYDGEILKVMINCENSAGSTTVTFVNNGAKKAKQTIVGVGTDTVIFDVLNTYAGVGPGSVDRTFSQGDVLSVSISPANAPGEVQVTSVWSYTVGP